MFITNRLSPVEMFEELLKKQPLDKAATSRFKGKEHDRDLCPGFEGRITSILDAYKAYGFECNDIQGLRDDGVDVLLTYSDLEDNPHRVGLQIKSYSEIENWKSQKNSGFLTKLKAQFVDAIGKVNLERYYIILCTDALLHQKQLRMVAAEFKVFNNVTIIKPQQALRFFEMSQLEVEISTIRTLCKHDAVLTASENEIGSETGIYAYLLLYLLCRSYAGDNSISLASLGSILDDWTERGGDDDSDDLANAVSKIERSGVLLPSDSYYSIDPRAFPLALSALYFDLRFRRNVAPNEAFEQMYELLDLAS